VDGTVHVISGLGAPGLPAPAIKPSHRHMQVRHQEGL